MPEASVHKHCDLRTGEHHVWTDEEAVRLDSKILSKAETPPVQGRTQRYLRFCVHASIGASES